MEELMGKTSRHSLLWSLLEPLPETSCCAVLPVIHSGTSICYLMRQGPPGLIMLNVMQYIGKQNLTSHGGLVSSMMVCINTVLRPRTRPGVMTQQQIKMIAKDREVSCNYIHYFISVTILITNDNNIYFFIYLLIFVFCLVVFFVCLYPLMLYHFVLLCPIGLCTNKKK